MCARVNDVLLHPFWLRCQVGPDCTRMQVVDSVSDHYAGVYGLRTLRSGKLAPSAGIFAGRVASTAAISFKTLAMVAVKPSRLSRFE